MDHREARRALSAMIDGELAPERIGPLEEHLAGCSECARWARTLEAVRAHFDALPRPTAPADLRERVLGRIRRPGAKLLTIRPLLKVVAAAAALLLIASSTAIYFTPKPPAAPMDFTADGALDIIMDDIVREQLSSSPGKEENR
jgi:anti-sigma factor RsiW